MASLYAARVFRVNVLGRIQLFSSRGPRARSRALLDPAPNERAGCLILEEDVATLQPPREQHAVGALHEGEEGVARPAHLGVPRLRVIAHPLRGGGVEAEVPPEDHAAVVELEALRSVDAADLVDAPGVGRPEVGARDAGGQPAGVRLGVPGHRPVADLDVRNKLADLRRVRPVPAEPGRQPRGEAIGVAPSNQPPPPLDRIDAAKLDTLPPRHTTV